MVSSSASEEDLAHVQSVVLSGLRHIEFISGKVLTGYRFLVSLGTRQKQSRNKPAGALILDYRFAL